MMTCVACAVALIAIGAAIHYRACAIAAQNILDITERAEFDEEMLGMKNRAETAEAMLDMIDRPPGRVSTLYMDAYEQTEHQANQLADLAVQR